MTNAVSIAQGGSNNITFRNKIINGNMVVDQRNAGASVTNNTTWQYVVDRFGIYGSVGSKFTAQQSATAPSGFINSLVLTSSSAYSVGSTDQFLLKQPIEGLNITDLGWGAVGAQTVTLSFWVRSSLTGTFSGALKNGGVGGQRSYVFTYTINSANTWEQKIITVAGDTSGTWSTNNGVGILLWFDLGGGSTYRTTAGSWVTGDYQGATGAVNLVGTSGATFYITGVQLEAGTTATPFENLQYGTQLNLCQRYFQRFDYSASYNGSNGVAFPMTKWSVNDAAVASTPLNCSMRTAPTVTSSYSGLRVVSAAVITTSSITGLSSTQNGPIIIATSNNSIAATYGWLDTIGVLSVTAEL